MKRALKWSIPALAVLGLVLGWSALTAKAQDAAPAKGTVTGVVQDKDGKGVPNIAVRLMTPRTRGGAKGQASLDPVQPQQLQRQQAPAVAEATTDAEGKFTLTAPAGEYQIMAGSREAGMARQAVTVKANEKVEVTLKLEPRPAGGGKGGKGGN